MLFYQIDATADNIIHVLPQEANRHTLENIRTKIERFRLESKENGVSHFLFLEAYQSDTLSLGAAMQNLLCSEHLDFLDRLGFTGVQILSITEITGSRLSEMLDRADRLHLIRHSESWLESISCLRFHQNGEFSFHTKLRDALLPQAPLPDEISQQAKALMCSQTMLPELDRIRQPAPPQCPSGHPVHYLIQMSTRDGTERAITLLLSTLYQSGRLESQRYCTCSLSDMDSPHDLIDAYRNASHGALIVYCEELRSDGSFAEGDTRQLQQLAKTFRCYSNDVLLLFCMPPEANRAKATLQEEIGDIVLVEIKEEVVSWEEAAAYLRFRAEQSNLPAEASLWEKLPKSSCFCRQELNEHFQRWRSRLMRTRFYPQYAELSSAREQVLSCPPQGSAYDQLQEMIGLKQVKAIVDQILDYAKIQSLYTSRGIVRALPSLHMVFTGNPGSAKTTVARLLAEILAEHQVLSKGRMYEVGRADLVGKYVGWTAKLVREAFRKAEGSLLFIDEAYSLADGQGKYGDEAINTIVQEMENARDRTVVVFAGYPDKMEYFLDQNPGLRSRIAFHVPFDDYTPQELVEITHLLASQKQMTLAPGTEERLLSIYRQVIGTPDFGNGRLARNLLEQACMRQASRLIHACPEEIDRELGILQAEDFAAPTYHRKPDRRVIGFAS